MSDRNPYYVEPDLPGAGKWLMRESDGDRRRWPATVARRADVDRVAWDVLVAVLTDSGPVVDAAVDRVASAVAGHYLGRDWAGVGEADRESSRELARAAIAALRSTGQEQS